MSSKCTEHSPEQAKALLQKVRQLFDSHKIGETLSLVKHLAKFHIEDVDEWLLEFYWGAALSYTDRRVDAIDHLKKADRLLPRDESRLFKIELLRELAHNYYMASRHDDALECYSQAEVYFSEYTSPDWEISRYLFRLGKGRCLVALGQYAEAQAEYQAARAIIEQLPADSENDIRRALLAYELGEACWGLGDGDTAERWFFSADPELLASSGLSADVHFGRLKTSVVQGRFSAALSEYQLSQKRGLAELHQAAAHYWVGRALLGLGRVEEAHEHFRQALSYKDQPDWLADSVQEWMQKSAN